MKARKKDETDAAYIKRLEDANAALRKHNKDVADYADRVREATYTLAVDGSLAFQAMAEKAEVRGHPSVTKMVEYFDQFAGLQWGRDSVEKVEFPEDWDFDKSDEWSGDADMQLNAELTPLIEATRDVAQWGDVKDGMRKHLRGCILKAENALRSQVDGVKANHGFRPHVMTIKQAPDHIGWALLDLAQDMNFANEMLRRDLRASVYRRVCGELYALSQAEFAEEPPQFDVKLFGGEVPF